MATLAKVADVEARIGRQLTDEVDTQRVQALLEDASAAVRAYTKRLFGSGTGSVRLRPRGGVIRLRSGIAAVDSVKTIPPDVVDVAFIWDGIDRLVVSGIDRFDVEPAWADAAVDVNYSYANDIPDIVKAITAQMAARAFGVKADTAGVQQQSIAGYSYSVGAAAAAGGVGMLPEERALLFAFRPIGGNAWVAMR